MTDCRGEFPRQLVYAQQSCARSDTMRETELLWRERLAVACSLAAQRLDSSAGSTRVVSVVTAAYYTGRRTADDARQIRRWRAIARHASAIRKHCERGRPRVPPKAATGGITLGIRQPQDLTPAIRIGISSCLLGEGVRFDGGHKRDAYPHRDLRAIRGVGAGMPRSRMRSRYAARNRCGSSALGDGVRLLTGKTGVDLTDRMVDDTPSGASKSSRPKRCAATCLKKDSPSCGLERVKVYGAHKVCRAKSGRGIFAARLDRTVPEPSCRRRRAAVGSAACARTSSSVCSHTGRLRGLFSSKWNVRRARRLPYRAQADPDGTLARCVSVPRASGCPARRPFLPRIWSAVTPTHSWPRSA